MTLYNQIMNGIKSFFGLETDATESEIHEALRGFQSVADFRTSIRTEVEKDIRQGIEDEFFKQKTDLETALSEANKRADDLQTQVATLTGKAEKLAQDLQAKITELEAAQATVKKLEALPAVSVSLGRTETESSAESTSQLPAWEAYKKHIAAMR